MKTRKFRKRFPSAKSTDRDALFDFSSERWGGFGLLPGAVIDYASKAGHPWECSPVAIGVGWIQRNLVEPPFAIERELSGGEREIVRKHPFIDLLKNCSERHDLQSLFAGSATDLAIEGNAFLESTKVTKSGRILKFEYVHTRNVEILWQGSSWIDGYKVNRDYISSEAPRLPEEVAHIRNGIDPVQPRRGMSPMRAQARKLVGANAGDSYEAGLLNNFGVPSLAISPKDAGVKLSKDDRDEIRGRWEQKHGRDQAGKVSVTSVPFNFDRVGFSPKDLSLSDMVYAFEMSLVAALGLNALVLCLPAAIQANTFANYGEANRHAYFNGLVPLGAKWCDGLSNSPIGRQWLEPGEKLIQDWTDVKALRDDQTSSTNIATTLLTAGIIDRNEARSICGFPPAAPKTPEPVLPEPIPPEPAKSLPDPIEPIAIKQKLVDQLTDILEGNRQRAEEIVNAWADGKVKVDDALPDLNTPKQVEDFAAQVQSAFLDQATASAQATNAATNAIRVRAGLPAIEFLVVNPEVITAANTAAAAFSASTLNTMAKAVGNAQAQFRGDLAGHLQSGDAPAAFIKHLRDSMGLSRRDAIRLAYTEMSRATHAGANVAALASGVVQGWEWLLSSDACPICQGIKESMPQVDLGQDFAQTSDHEFYGKIKHPPAHPECNCTVVAVLKPEFRPS